MFQVCYRNLTKYFNNLQTSGHYTYHQFNIKQFHELLTRTIYVFYEALRTNSDYFPIQN